MKVVLGDGKPTIECSPEEYMLIHPLIMNGRGAGNEFKQRTISRKVVQHTEDKPKTSRSHTRSKNREQNQLSEKLYRECMEKLATHYPDRAFQGKQAAKTLKLNEMAVYRSVRRAMKEGLIVKTKDRRFKFNPEKLQRNDHMQYKASEPVNGNGKGEQQMSVEEFVDELQSMAGAYQFDFNSIVKRHKNIEKKEIKSLLTEAIAKGLIQQSGNWYRVKPLQKVAT